MRDKSRWVYLAIFIGGLVASIVYLSTRPTETSVEILKSFKVPVPVEQKPWYTEPAWYSVGLSGFGFLWTVLKDFLRLGRGRG